MAFLSNEEIQAIGFKSIGRNVKISNSAKFYFPDDISIGDDSRVDDFVVLSGKVKIGRNVHLAIGSNLAGGKLGIEIGDFSGTAYYVQIVAQSDDYSGTFLTNPTIPQRYLGTDYSYINIGKHCIIGTNSVLLPGAALGDGVAIGALSLVRKVLNPWTIYSGNPLRKIGMRKQDLLVLEQKFLAENS